VAIRNDQTERAEHRPAAALLHRERHRKQPSHSRIDALRNVGSAGRPALFVDIRIAGRDGAASAVGEIDELLVRGLNVMAGYWTRPEETRQAIDEEGWLRTGDAAHIEEDGFLFIVGRLADAYVSAGDVVHPGLVERVLLQHPAVAEACVVGGDDGAIAYIVLADGATSEVEPELFSLCADHLAVHARPDAIEFVSSLPRNPGGKIMRHLLRRPRAGFSARRHASVLEEPLRPRPSLRGSRRW
jgi:acyl-CoA synthetase (AMP-forming)/AMP-acid ligase II